MAENELPEITPSIADVTCPSGLSGRIRRLRIKDLDILSSTVKAKDGGNVDAFLASAWTGLVDHGPYQQPWVDFSNGVRWPQVLSGDRTWVLLALRIITCGPMFHFRITCRQTRCGHQYDSAVDLGRVGFHGMSPEAAASLACGQNVHYRVLPLSQRRVGFRLLTGEDDVRQARVLAENPENLVTAITLMRLEEIDGATSPSERRRFVTEMDVEDSEWLTAEWEAADVWVDQMIETTCPQCARTSSLVIPFDSDFFSRRSSRPRSISAR